MSGSNSRLTMHSLALVLTVSALFFPPAPVHATAIESLLPSWLKGQDNAEKERFAAAKATALADKDPWHAWVTLSSGTPDNMSSDIREQYRALGIALVLQAAKQNNLEALVMVFERDDVSAFTDNRSGLFASLVRLADQSSGGRDDRALLTTTGDVLQEGRWAARDSLRAAAFYSRAWSAGDDDAPSRLFSLYSTLRDPGSAYLWQLRCINSCRIFTTSDAPEQFLSSRQIQWIQRQAGDHSILTINGIAARKELQ